MNNLAALLECNTLNWCSGLKLVDLEMGAINKRVLHVLQFKYIQDPCREVFEVLGL